MDNPRKITVTLNGDAHPFFRIANVTWRDRGVGDRPDLGELEGGGEGGWPWMQVAKNTSHTGADRQVYEHTPEGG